MCIKPLCESIFLTPFTTQALSTYVSCLKPDQLHALEKEVSAQALRDGVMIADWDKEWGKYHLFDDKVRLVRALFEKKFRDVTLLNDPRFINNFLTTQELEKHVFSLGSDQLYALQKEVYSQALENGVKIADWDKEWGKYHLFDDQVRLISILFKKQQKESLLTRNRENLREVKEIEQHKALAKLKELGLQLSIRYPWLFDSKSQSLFRSHWKALSIHYLCLSIPFHPKESERFHYLVSVIEEILNGQYDDVTVQILLDQLMRKESFHPTSTELSNDLQLRKIHQITQDQIKTCRLENAKESLWKSIYVVPSVRNKQGKFKPLVPESVKKEVYAAWCDQLCGFEMTAPTRSLHVKDMIYPTICKVGQLFHEAAVKIREKKWEEAAALKQQALAWFHHPHVPQDVRNGVFAEMYNLSGKGCQVEHLGELLFYDIEAYQTPYQEKAIAIHNYLQSESFKQHLKAFNIQGSVQVWINYCQRVYDWIVKDPEAGKKLKTAPKALVHCYALLGILKGSQDGSSGNTLVKYSSKLGRVVNFLDFDDERSMPTKNHFEEVRMWQMGLPQSAQPFDRALLLMFLDPHLKEKFMRQQAFAQMSKEACVAQLERLDKMKTLFEQELTKAKITLSPRELFFKIFGGKEEFNAVKNKFNENRFFDPEILISPIEIFEFYLSGMGKEQGYSPMESEIKCVRRNMKDLFSY